MKLLLDENLSSRIVPQIIDLFPGSSHVKAHPPIHAFIRDATSSLLILP